jgi:hypothetical protein
MYYEVFRFRKDIRWSVRKEFSRNRLTQETFPTIEEAESWIRENHKPEYHFDRPWINHVIDGSYGHLMLLDVWKEDCDQGGFIDYDGHGDLVSENYEFIGSSTRPSDHTYKKRNYPIEAKYILWYNK